MPDACRGIREKWKEKRKDRLGLHLSPPRLRLMSEAFCIKPFQLAHVSYSAFRPPSKQWRGVTGSTFPFSMAATNSIASTASSG